LTWGQAEAIYEDDEMAGGPGSQASIAPPKMPFRATFETAPKVLCHFPRVFNHQPERVLWEAD